MRPITRAQRESLKRVYDRCDLADYVGIGATGVREEKRTNLPLVWGTPKSYRAFRRTVHHGYDCIMVPWCGMWLGIEPDGYTHS